MKWLITIILDDSDPSHSSTELDIQCNYYRKLSTKTLIVNGARIVFDSDIYKIIKKRIV